MATPSNPLKGMTGGEGTSDWGVQKYGMSPTAAPGQGNFVKINGGKKRRANSRKGGYGISQVLVPAALFAANYAYGKRGSLRLPKFSRSNRRSSRRFRRGSRRFRR